MKKMISFVCLLLATVAVQAQDDAAKQFEPVIKRMMERNVQAPPYCNNCDAAGVLLVRVEKKGGRFYRSFLFNSLKTDQVLEESSLNQPVNLERAASIPDGYHCTVPVMIYYVDTKGTQVQPDATTKKRYEERLASLKGKERIIGEVVVVGYAPMHKSSSDR